MQLLLIMLCTQRYGKKALYQALNIHHVPVDIKWCCRFVQALHSERQSDLFQGVSIFVNGWTQPSALELKQLMALNGGRYVNYYSR